MQVPGEGGWLSPPGAGPHDLVSKLVYNLSAGPGSPIPPYAVDAVWSKISPAASIGASTCYITLAWAAIHPAPSVVSTIVHELRNVIKSAYM